MTARADAARKRIAVRLGVATAALALLAVAVVAWDAASRRVETVEGLIAPQWSERFADARAVRVISPDGVLTLARNGESWTLTERENHPVNPAAITALHRALTALRFSGARTSDPANHDRLGVTDPGQGGSGVRLTVLDADGAALEDWIFGAVRQGGFFVRRPGEAQTYAAVGELPDLDAPSFWLDLDLLRLDRADLEAVEIAPADGRAYRLTRGAPAAADFVLAEPAEGFELITAGAANGPGGAAAGLRFIDVRGRDVLDGAPLGRHVAHTFDGLAVSLEVVRDGQEDWAVLEASADPDGAPAAAEQAAALNARADGWAYRLPPYASDRLVRTLDGIARPVGDGDPER